MDIKHKTIDQNWMDETTIYWFEVDSVDYGIADNNGTISLLDDEGCPIEPCNDHNNILGALMPFYESHISSYLGE